jgi:V/A-type H+-transporting ATPase subunit I
MATAYAGLLASAGGGAAGAAEAGVGLFDLVLRLGSNLVSFARLAAFGLTHAALGAVVWQATVGLWPQGGLGAVGAVLVFLLGNAVAFALEGLVAAIQALRLEYYELFSRVFDTEGWPFRPWHVPLDTSEVPC